MNMEEREFDVTNCLVIGGVIYALVTKEQVCPEDPTNHVCELCSLRAVCVTRIRNICSLFEARPEEFFHFVGHIKSHNSTVAEIHTNDDWKIHYGSTVENEG